MVICAAGGADGGERFDCGPLICLDTRRWESVPRSAQIAVRAIIGNSAEMGAGGCRVLGLGPGRVTRLPIGAWKDFLGGKVAPDGSMGASLSGKSFLRG